MGYVLTKEAFDKALKKLAEERLIYAPVLKVGEGRFTDTDVVRYDYVTELSQIELSKKSDYAFKEILTPLSETLFFFTENEVKTADRDSREVIVFLKSCDMHAVRRLDQIYMNNVFVDPFYKEIRDRIKFVLIGCQKSGADCFCVDMGTNRTTEGYLFSVDVIGDEIHCDVKCDEVAKIFAECGGREEASTAHAASAAGAATSYVPPAHATRCRMCSIPRTARSAREEESALPAWWTVTPMWPEAVSTEGPRVRECASRCFTFTRSLISARDSAMTCASAAAAATWYVRSTFRSPHASTRSIRQ